MIIVHDTFICKPGQASKMAKMFKDAMGDDENVVQVMTDMTGQFNKVVMVTKFEDLSDFEGSWKKHMQDTAKMKEMEEKMKGYHDMFLTGSREIYKVW